MMTIAVACVTTTSGLSRLTTKVSSPSAIRSVKMVMFTHWSGSRGMGGERALKSPYVR